MVSKEKRKRKAQNLIKQSSQLNLFPSVAFFFFKVECKYNYSPISILKLVMTIVINLFPFLCAANSAK